MTRKRPCPRSQSGFTLIELIVVIIILGILAAVALPRFIDLQIQARQAKLNSAIGAVRSASALFHAQCLAQAAGNPPVACPADGTTSTTVNMEGMAVTGIAQYPTADMAGIGAAAGLRAGTLDQYKARPGDYDYYYSTGSSGTGGGAATLTISVPSPTDNACSFTYTAGSATGSLISAPVVTVTSTTCN